MPLPPAEFDPAIAADLACPACHGDLRVEAARLVCTSCGRAYPIVDGIPVLIAERAETQAGQSSE
ncbi:MAG: Trm112 family protein [Terracidiphilus sp.]